MNGTFDTQTSPWYSWSLDNSHQLGLEAGGARLSHDTASGLPAQLFQTFESLTAGNDYRLRFEVRGNQDGAPLSTYLQQSNDPYGRLSQIEVTQLSTQTQRVDVVLTATQDQASATLIIEIDDQTETMWIDNISLVDVSAVSLVANGTFDTESRPWFSWAPDKSNALTVDAGVARLTHDTSAGLRAQVFQSVGAAVVEGNRYRLRFEVRGNQDGAQLSTFLQQSGGPYGRVSAPEIIQLSTQTQAVDVVLTAKRDQAASTLIISIDGQTETIWIDNISLVELPS